MALFERSENLHMETESPFSTHFRSAERDHYASRSLWRFSNWLSKRTHHHKGARVNTTTPS
eukprot:3059331-Amphidinium_carterae.2